MRRRAALRERQGHRRRQTEEAETECFRCLYGHMLDVAGLCHLGSKHSCCCCSGLLRTTWPRSLLLPLTEASHASEEQTIGMAELCRGPGTHTTILCGMLYTPLTSDVWNMTFVYSNVVSILSTYLSIGGAAIKIASSYVRHTTRRYLPTNHRQDIANVVSIYESVIMYEQLSTSLDYKSPAAAVGLLMLPVRLS